MKNISAHSRIERERSIPDASSLSKSKDGMDASQRPYILLLIEDNPSDAKLFERNLGSASDSDKYWLVHVKRLSTAVKMLKRDKFDLVVLDLRLPDSSGIESLHIVQEVTPDIPVVILTGMKDDRLCEEALVSGAQDYLQKGILDGNQLSRSLLHAIERQKHINPIQDAAKEKASTGADLSEASEWSSSLDDLRSRFVSGLSQCKRVGSKMGFAVLEISSADSSEAAFSLTPEMNSIWIQRCQRALGLTDNVVRIGPSSYGIIFSEIVKDHDIFLPIEKLMTLLNLPIYQDSKKINYTSRMGISLIPSDASTFEGALESARLALQKSALEVPPCQTVFVSGEMNNGLKDRQAIRGIFTQAIKAGNFEVQYLPAFDMERDEVKEILVLPRMKKSGLEYAQAGEFVPTLKSVQLLPRVNRWLFETACRDAARWKRHGIRLPNLVFHFSEAQIHDEEFVDFVCQALRTHGLNFDSILFQILSSEWMSAGVQMSSFVTQLKNLGVRFILDEVGELLSAVDALKDDSFFQINLSAGVVGDFASMKKDDISSPRMLIELAHRYDTKILAKKIETEEEWNRVRLAGCDLVQGFFMSTSLDSRQTETILWKHASNNPLFFIS